MTVDIEEVLRRSDQGQTEPFICRGSDEEIYFVKGRGASRRSLLCEWVAGNLGYNLGLPIPPFEIVDVPEELFEVGSSLDLYDLGPGPAFGSLQRSVMELTPSSLLDIPKEQQMDVLAFDWWVHNSDRWLSEKGGNPNLFLDADSHELIVLDHNLAFDPNFDTLDFLDHHVFSGQQRDVFTDMLRRRDYNARFADALGKWPEIVGAIPQEWYFLDQEMTVPIQDFDPSEIYKFLSRFNKVDFWNTQ